jgi:gluconolactonase
MTTALAHSAFGSYSPEFEQVLGDSPGLSRLVESDAHEGPVYFADENALYFTTLPRRGIYGSPSVQVKRVGMERPEPVSVVVEETNIANGMAPDGEGALGRAPAGHKFGARPDRPRRSPDRPARDPRRGLGVTCR